MNKHLLYLSVALIITLSAVGLMAASRAEIPNSTFNFGKVSQQVTIYHTFWVKSTGDDTLIITRVEPGCGCTKAPVQDTVLAPGDSTRMQIFFSTWQYRGYVIKKPHIITNAPDSITYAQILAEPITDPSSIHPVTVEPFKVDVSQFSSAVRRKATFKIINKGSQDYPLELVEASGGVFDVDLPPLVKAGETVEGTITVHENAVEVEFQTSFTFEVGDEGRTRFTLPVRRIYRAGETGEKTGGM